MRSKVRLIGQTLPFSTTIWLWVLSMFFFCVCVIAEEGISISDWFSGKLISRWPGRYIGNEIIYDTVFIWINVLTWVSRPSSFQNIFLFCLFPQSFTLSFLNNFFSSPVFVPIPHPPQLFYNQLSPCLHQESFKLDKSQGTLLKTRCFSPPLIMELMNKEWKQRSDISIEAMFNMFTDPVTKFIPPLAEINQGLEVKMWIYLSHLITFSHLITVWSQAVNSNTHFPALFAQSVPLWHIKTWHFIAECSVWWKKKPSWIFHLIPTWKTPQKHCGLSFKSWFTR